MKFPPIFFWLVLAASLPSTAGAHGAAPSFCAAPGGPADLERMFQKESELWTRLASEIKLQPD